MTVVVNGHPRTLAPEATVADLVAVLGHDPARAGVAVAVNGQIVARRDWSGAPLADGDAVEVVTAVQGG